jgi:hypothetical protein
MRVRHIRMRALVERLAAGCHWLGWCGLVALVSASSGCAWLQTPTKQTSALVKSIEGTVWNKPVTNALARTQSEVMREADAYATIIAQAADDFANKVGTVEARTDALQWKLQQATAAYINATGENPNLNAVDMVVLATLSRAVIENYWVGQKYGSAAVPLLEAHRKLEQGAFAVARSVLPRAQEEELRKLALEWWQRFPNQHYVGAVRLREFSAVLGKNGGDGLASRANSVLNLLNLDPLSGLDPAVRAIEQTRYLAERMMYYAERAPLLLSWQVELLTYRVTDQPPVQQALSNLTSLSQSAAVFAQTAQELPSLVNTQREAAINQLFAGIATERSNILASLESQETRLQQLLPEVRQTLATGGNMANSLDGAIKSLDTFVRYVSPPDTNPAPAATNSQPFNVLDYGKAATQIGAMSRDLNLLISSANQSATQLVVLGEQASSKAERVVDHAFHLSLLLILLLLVGSVLAGLTYHFLTGKLARRQPDSAAHRP